MADDKAKEEEFPDNALQAPSDFAGPISDRKRTDLLWLLLFVAHWVALTGLAFVAFGWANSSSMGQGHPKLLTHWMDHNGRTCGDGDHADVAKKPYLYFPNPLGRWSDDDSSCSEALGCYKVTGGPNKDAVPSSLYGVCVHSCPQADETIEDYSVCNANGTACNTFNGYKSARVLKFCVPHVPALKLSDDAISETGNAAFSFFQGVIGDVFATRVPVGLTGGLLPFLMGFVYLLLLRVPGVLFTLIWGSILGIFGLLVVGGYVLMLYYNQLKNSDDDGVDGDDSSQTYEIVVRVLGIALWVFAVLFFCLVCFMRRAIMLAMGIIKEASRAVCDMMAIVLLPFFLSLCMVIFIGYAFIVCVYIVSAGEKSEVTSDSFGSLELPYKTYEIKDQQFYALWYVLFSFYWTLEFLKAMGQLITATAAAAWYFSRDKSTVSSRTIAFAFHHATKYHAGTAAFGALVIAVIQFVKAVLTYVQTKMEFWLKKTPTTCVNRVIISIAHCVFCCLRCCLWCLEKCMRFLNKQAYIQTAIFGCSFCTACRKSFFLVARNLRRVAALDGVGNLIFLLMKVMIAATCALVGFLWMDAYFLEETQSIVFPTVIVFCLAYKIGAAFIGVVDMVGDTILICFITDEELFGNSDRSFATDTLRGYIEKRGVPGSEQEEQTLSEPPADQYRHPPSDRTPQIVSSV